MEKCRLMIVEDEASIRRGIINLLDWESNGYVIAGEAENGVDALEKLPQCRPHIVITDVMMPEMNGIELVKALHETAPWVRVLVLSGYSDFEYVRASFQGGACDYILKPTLSPQELLASLDRLAVQLFPEHKTLSAEADSPAAQLRVLLTADPTGEPTAALRQTLPYPSFLLVGLSQSYLYAAAAQETALPLLQALAQEHFAEIPFVSLALNDQLLLLLNPSPALQDACDAKLLQLVEHFCEKHRDAFFVHTDWFRELDAIRGIYHSQLCGPLTSRFYYRDQALVCWRQLCQAPGSDRNSTQAHPALPSFSGHPDEDARQLLSTLTAIVQQKAMAEAQLKSLAQGQAYSLLLRLEDSGVDEQTVASFKRLYLAQIGAARFSQELLETVRQLVQAIAQEVESQRNMDQILAYIQQNFTQRLTLADLAAQFSFNYYYLSSYFSSRYNESFHEYLNRLRIQHAKVLLADEAIPIAEVASLAGYTDNSYFARAFKKSTGLSPSRYRTAAQTHQGRR